MWNVYVYVGDLASGRFSRIRHPVLVERPHLGSASRRIRQRESLGGIGTPAYARHGGGSILVGLGRVHRKHVRARKGNRLYRGNVISSIVDVPSLIVVVFLGA